jgi:6-pyruvoyltetrahydropterin/6-carboxytetrahydropterin synthase
MIYSIKKTIEIAGAHKLCLDYNSPCKNLHGHNWFITVEVSSNKLDQNGMILDFKYLKTLLENTIISKLDHQNLNEVLDFNPTAEQIAQWILNELNEEFLGTALQCTCVEVQESRDNVATYRRDYI